MDNFIVLECINIGKNRYDHSCCRERNTDEFGSGQGSSSSFGHSHAFLPNRPLFKRDPGLKDNCCRRSPSRKDQRNVSGPSCSFCSPKRTVGDRPCGFTGHSLFSRPSGHGIGPLWRRPFGQSKDHSFLFGYIF